MRHRDVNLMADGSENFQALLEDLASLPTRVGSREIFVSNGHPSQVGAFCRSQGLFGLIIV